MSRRAKPKRDVEPLGAVLGRDRMIRSLIAHPVSPVPARDWELAVGSRIAARARPVRLERGVLQVVTTSAAWAQELSMLSDAIVAQLRALGVEVRSLRFKIGKLEAPAVPARRASPKRVPVEAPLAPSLTRSLEEVHDDELRLAIEHAARRSLGFNRRG